MIKIKLISFLLLSPILMLAEQATVSGTLSNCGIKKIAVSIEKTFISPDNFLEEIIVNDNTFKYSFDLDRNRIVNLNSDEFAIALYLEPGDDIHINFDPSSDIPLQFEGIAASNNIIFNKFRAEFNHQYDLELIKDKIATTSFDPYEIEAYDSQREQNKLVSEHDAYATTSAKFKVFMDLTMRYQYYNQLLAYPIVRGNSNTDPKVVPLPRVIVDEIEALEVSNDEAIISEAYRNFLLYYSTYFTSKNNDYNKFTDQTVSLMHKTEYANSKLSNEAKFYMIAKFTYDICEKASAGLVNKNYLQLKKNSKYKQYADAIATKCGDAMKNPAKAEPISKPVKAQNDSKGINFMFKGLDGKTRNISDYNGKIVYIDFWASWCGPCRVQFPYSHSLQEKFTEKQKKNIVFLYLSIDESEERWKGAIESNKLQGEQGISPGNWNSEAVKKFGISGIPRYMIIGKDGEILDPNAPRPGAPGLYEKLLNLL